MGRAKRRRGRPSKIIGCKAFLDTDRDILEWWESIEESQRSHRLRGVVRMHLRGEAAQEQPLEVIRQEVVVLRQEVQALTALIQVGVTLTPGPSPEARGEENQGLSQDEVEKRREKLARRKW